jgi:hypothetical protein
MSQNVNAHQAAAASFAAAFADAKKAPVAAAAAPVGAAAAQLPAGQAVAVITPAQAAPAAPVAAKVEIKTAKDAEKLLTDGAVPADVNNYQRAAQTYGRGAFIAWAVSAFFSLFDARNENALVKAANQDNANKEANKAIVNPMVIARNQLITAIEDYDDTFSAKGKAETPVRQRADRLDRKASKASLDKAVETYAKAVVSVMEQSSVTAPEAMKLIATAATTDKVVQKALKGLVKATPVVQAELPAAVQTAVVEFAVNQFAAEKDLDRVAANLGKFKTSLMNSFGMTEAKATELLSNAFEVAGQATALNAKIAEMKTPEYASKQAKAKIDELTAAKKAVLVEISDLKSKIATAMPAVVDALAKQAEAQTKFDAAFAALENSRGFQARPQVLANFQKVLVKSGLQAALNSLNLQKDDGIQEAVLTTFAAKTVAEGVVESKINGEAGVNALLRNLAAAEGCKVAQFTGEEIFTAADAKMAQTALRNFNFNKEIAVKAAANNPDAEPAQGNLMNAFNTFFARVDKVEPSGVIKIKVAQANLDTALNGLKDKLEAERKAAVKTLESLLPADAAKKAVAQVASKKGPVTFFTPVVTAPVQADVSAEPEFSAADVHAFKAEDSDNAIEIGARMAEYDAAIAAAARRPNRLARLRRERAVLERQFKDAVRQSALAVNERALSAAVAARQARVEAAAAPVVLPVARDVAPVAAARARGGIGS